MISLAKIKKLPDSPGVYLFKDNRGRILYVGKATSLRSRVRSYFSGKILETRGQLVEQMVALAKKVDFIVTDSVLEALILEANLIKKYQPFHNTMAKDDKSFNFLVITAEEFPRVLTMRGRELEKNFRKIYGPFPNGLAFKEAVKIVRRIFPFRDKCQPAEDFLTVHPDLTPRPCFNSQIGLCPGVCSGKISAEEYGRIIRHIMLFFDGRKKELVTTLEREMKNYARKMEFEKAAATRRTLFALKHIQDVALIRREKDLGDLDRTDQIFRVEAYDVAHISGSSTVGVMTVVENSEKRPAQYRMFRIRGKAKGDDLKALAEVLTRRFSHPEWGAPNLIVIDGGQTHLDSARAILKNLHIEVVTVSVVKDKNHKPREILGGGNDGAENSLTETASRRQPEIFLANSEAHRFAIKYHKNLRGRNFIPKS